MLNPIIGRHSSNQYIPTNFIKLLGKFNEDTEKKEIVKDIGRIKSSLNRDNAYLIPKKFNELIEKIKIKDENIENITLKSQLKKRKEQLTPIKKHIAVEDKGEENMEHIKQRSRIECEQIMQTARAEGYHEAMLIKCATKSCHSRDFRPNRVLNEDKSIVFRRKKFPDNEFKAQLILRRTLKQFPKL